MSRSLADRLRSGAGDEGFGLVEILIAMTIFAIVSVSTAPMLLGGLRAGRAAQLNLQGKALAQERLEKMRNLPFHVARQNGQYLDVLDIYFRDLLPSGLLAAGDTCSARSYDSTTATYSCTIASLGGDYPGFSQVVRTTFLDFQRGTVVPPSTYDSQTSGNDSPASALLGVAVTTSWTQGGKSSSYTLRSQISNSQADESSLRASLQLAAVKITSELDGGDVLRLDGGVISSEGSLTTGSTASLNVATARGSTGSGQQVDGAVLSLSAPPAKTGGSPSDPSGQKLDGTCNLVCFGKTAVTGNQDVTVNLGQPQVSDPADAVTASLSRTGSNVFRGFSFGNLAGSQVADPDLRLQGRMVSAGATGDSLALSSNGYLDATGTGSAAVRSGGRVSVPMLQLFPTDFAPRGVVQVTLDSAALDCTSGSGTSSVNSAWQATVRYWQQTGVDATTGLPTGGYVSNEVKPGAGPLPDPTTTYVLHADSSIPHTELGPGDVPLSTWINAWNGASDAAAVNTSVGKAATASLNAVVAIITAPTRENVPTSALNLAVGTIECQAVDNR